MKLAVVYGNMRKQNTYGTVQKVLGYLGKREQLEVAEYRLPKDLPAFCKGCLNCITVGEHVCPQAHLMQPVIEDICAADGVIIASPVYIMSMTGALKNFFDHMAYLFITHRPRKELFSKSAFIVSTTAGSGTRHCIAAIRRSLLYFGFPAIVSFGFALRAETLKEMECKRGRRMEQLLERKAMRFHRSLITARKPRPYLMQRLMFLLGRRLVRKFASDYPDRVYWEKMGWMQGRFFV